MSSRTEEMRDARTRGESLQEIGERYGLSRERVRQILLKTYGTADMGQRPRASTAVRERLLDEYRTEVIEALHADPTALSARDIVAQAPVHIPSAASLLGSDGWAVLPAQAGTPGRISDEEIFSALRKVWESSTCYPGPMSRVQYDAQRPDDFVSGGRIGQRMKWSEACKGAGIPARKSVRTYPPAISREEALEWVTRFVAEYAVEAESVSARGYEEWSRSQPGAPSIATIRNLPGTSWRELRAEAVARVLRGETGEPVIRSRTNAEYPVEEWKALHEGGQSLRSIAREYGVSLAVVRYHVLRRAS